MNKKIDMQIKVSKGLLALAFGAGLALISAHNCSAYNYYRKFDKCLMESGGREGLSAVVYACGKASCDTAADGSCAAAGGQNGCSLWIGDAATGDTTIKVEWDQVSDIVPIAFWGMCTDYPNTTSAIWVYNDNDSIYDGNISLNRGYWNNPTSVGTKLDVRKFIEGITPTETECGQRYTRSVLVGRRHGGNSSSDEMWQDITVEVTGTCEQGDCRKFTPASYKASNSRSGTTSTVVKVQNSRLKGTYSGWQDVTYAKPTDVGEWLNCYYPGVQKQYGKDIYRTYIHGSHGMYSDGTFNTNYHPWESSVGWTWYNRYWFDSNSVNMLHPEEKSFSLGDYAIKEVTNTHETVNTDTLQIFSQTMYGGIPSYHAVNNEGRHSWSCFPYQTTCCGYYSCWTCTRYHTCHHSNNYWSVSRNDSWAQDSARMLVPYNYENRVEVVSPEEQHNVYSGEAFPIDGITLHVNPIDNEYTEDNYATTTPNLRLKLFAYVTTNPSGFSNVETGDQDGCRVIGNNNGKQCVTLRDGWIGKKNVEGNLSGYQEDNIWQGEYNALDASAGDYLCLVASIFPARRAINPGDMGANGNGNTWYSNPTCKIIAKKPTFQVWGSDMYSVNDLDAFVGEKRNILNEYNPTYKWQDFNGTFVTIGGGKIYLGSWVEEGLILKDGLTKTISSGAGTATNSSNAAMAGVKGTFCERRAALSFANYNSSGSSICPSQSVVGASKISSDISDREEILKYWMGDESWPVNVAAGSTINLSRPENVGTEAKSATGATIRYINTSGNMTISTSMIPKGVTYLIKSPKDVTISGDIRYEQGGYTSIQDIPKLVIYAKNIDIECGVSEVDAILITDPDESGNGGKVNTCSNAQTFGEDSSVEEQFAAWNDANRSQQLRIFGAAISDELYLERTYGAAAWNKVYSAYSAANYPNGTDGIPAEIFDYDSTLLMWSEYMAGSAETDTLNTVYQHELAPRY